MRFEYRGWTADVDVEATRRAYAQGSLGASAECACSECANFIAARDAGYVYPVEVEKLLSDMGADPSRESEVYVEGPAGRGSLVYGGWFNIAGQLLSGDGVPTEIETGFDLFPLSEGAAVDDAFGEDPVFRVEFRALVPWMDSLKRKK